MRRKDLLPVLKNEVHEQTEPIVTARAEDAPIYDLLVRGGRLIDPSQDLSADLDIAIQQGKVARIAPNIAESEARQVLHVRNMIVTPGLVDVHVHVYDGVAPLGIPADPNCIAKAPPLWSMLAPPGLTRFRVSKNMLSGRCKLEFTPS